MIPEELILNKVYNYINHDGDKIKVTYLGVESNGLTLYKFRHFDDKFTYSLFDFELIDLINEN